MSKSRHIKNYRTQFPTASEEVIDALKKSDRKIKYTEHELKCGKYDKATNTYNQGREVSLQMIEDSGVLFPDQTENIEDIVVRSILIEQMIKAVEHLSPEDKKLIFYYFVSEKSQKECAKILGVSRRTKTEKVYRKLKILKKIIEQPYLSA